MASTGTGSEGRKVFQPNGAVEMPQPMNAAKESKATNLFSRKKRIIAFSMVMI